MKQVTVHTLIERFNLQILAGEIKIDSLVTQEDYHRPGLQLSGFFLKFPNEKIQIMGNQEMEFLLSLSSERRFVILNEYMAHKPLCIIITHGRNVTDELITVAKKHEVPLLVSDKSTFEFTSKLVNFLEKTLAENIGVHGVCVNVHGIGILIRGESGVGKSEAALSLIERGHRLISDDLVVLKKIGPEALIASHNGVNRDFLALRGIGLINVTRLYGAGSFQDETKVNIDILLRNWDDKKYYDAVNRDESEIEYLGIKVPHIEIPVKPGRDIASLIEVAAKNFRLEQTGYDTLNEFQNRLKK